MANKSQPIPSLSEATNYELQSFKIRQTIFLLLGQISLDNINVMSEQLNPLHLRKVNSLTGNQRHLTY